MKTITFNILKAVYSPDGDITWQVIGVATSMEDAKAQGFVAPVLEPQ